MLFEFGELRKQRLQRGEACVASSTYYLNDEDISFWARKEEDAAKMATVVSMFSAIAGGRHNSEEPKKK